MFCFWGPMNSGRRFRSGKCHGILAEIDMNATAQCHKASLGHQRGAVRGRVATTAPEDGRRHAWQPDCWAGILMAPSAACSPCKERRLNLSCQHWTQWLWRGSASHPCTHLSRSHWDVLQTAHTTKLLPLRCRITACYLDTSLGPTADHSDIYCNGSIAHTARSFRCKVHSFSTLLPNWCRAAVSLKTWETLNGMPGCCRECDHTV